VKGREDKRRAGAEGGVGIGKGDFDIFVHGPYEFLVMPLSI